MNYFSVDEFVANRLPALTGHNHLHAMFSTYKDVDGYRNGPVETNKKGLNVTVYCGNLEYSSATMFGLTAGIFGGDRQLAASGSASMREEGRFAQEELEKQFREGGSQTDTDTLAVVYAGLSAFNEALQFARQLRAEYPKTSVVILTCDCEIPHKKRILDALLGSGEISNVVVTGECGGRQAMGKIVDGLIGTWPSA